MFEEECCLQDERCRLRDTKKKKKEQKQKKRKASSLGQNETGREAPILPPFTPRTEHAHARMREWHCVRQEEAREDEARMLRSKLTDLGPAVVVNLLCLCFAHSLSLLTHSQLALSLCLLSKLLQARTDCRQEHRWV